MQLAGTILIIHPTLGIGGAEKIIAFLANIFSDEYNVQLMLLKKGKHTLMIDSKVEIVTKECYSEVPIFGIHLYEGIHDFKYMSQCIKEKIEACKPNLVICFDLRVLLAVSMALKGKENLILFSERADPYENRKYWQMILKKIYKKIGKVIFQTDGARNFYNAKIKKKSCIIPNPALTRNLELKQDTNIIRENYIFAAGRLQHRKGFDLLIYAFGKIASIDSKLRLLIYGDGEEKEFLKSIIAELQLQDRILILPPASNIVEKNKTARLFVLPSRSEGIPNILIEVMLAGIPAVATDCSPGGARLLTDNGTVGLLADNNVDSLAEKLAFAVKNSHYMENLAKAALQSMKRFDPKVISEEWKNVVKEQIDKEK